MKILFVCGFYPEVGGPFSSLMNLLEKLHERHVHIKVVSPIPQSYNINRLSFVKNLPYEVIYIPQQLPRNIIPSFSLKFLSCIKQESKHADLIYLAGTFDFYSIAVYLTKTPYILSLRGIFMEEVFKRQPLIKRIKKKIFMWLIGEKILKNAIKIHCKTNEEKNYFLKYFPELKNKVIVIPNGTKIHEYRLDEYKNSDAKSRELIDRKIVLFLGRINWIKGLDILVHGFSKLRRERENIQLIIAGKDDGDGYERIVRKWIREYDIEESVTFTGFVTGERKMELFRKADVFIQPSYSENFGMSIIEAMNCGVPVIVSNKVGIVREIEEWRAGILIEPTVEGVYSGLKTWLNMEEDELKEITKRAKRMVSELYDIEKVADKMVKLFEEVIRHGS